jgi:hypothetical protein
MRAVHEVVAEIVVAVDRPDDIVIVRLLGLHGNLRLDLLVAGIQIAGSRRQSIELLADDLAAEASGRALHLSEIVLILWRVASDDEPSRPFLPDEILRDRVGPHRIVGDHMKDIDAALLLAELGGARADIMMIASRTGRSAIAITSRRLEIEDDEALAGKAPGLGNHVAVLRHDRPTAERMSTTSWPGSPPLI